MIQICSATESETAEPDQQRIDECGLISFERMSLRKPHKINSSSVLLKRVFADGKKGKLL
jgi:hypothetical protein